MRIMFLIALLAVGPVTADDLPKKSAIVQPIPELKLTNGTVFRNVTIIRYDKESVVLKSNAGLGPIGYNMIAEPVRSQMIAERDSAFIVLEEKARDDAAAEAKQQADAAKEAAKPIAYKGEIFIATKGGANVKLGDVTITAYSHKKDGDAAEFDLDSPPLATAQSDSEGRFVFQLIQRDLPALIIVRGSRLVFRNREFYEWRVSTAAFENPERVILSNSNLYGMTTRGE